MDRTVSTAQKMTVEVGQAACRSGWRLTLVAEALELEDRAAAGVVGVALGDDGGTLL
jgi:hypothetical protein